jgi:hypothetical protein
MSEEYGHTIAYNVFHQEQNCFEECRTYILSLMRRRAQDGGRHQKTEQSLSQSTLFDFEGTFHLSVRWHHFSYHRQVL